MNRTMAVALTFICAVAMADSSFELAEVARADKDWVSAFREYEKAVNDGHPVAAHWLGIFYFDGIDTKQSYLQAGAYFSIAANQGVQGSMVYLAKMHVAGQGVAKDCEKAESWVIKLSNGVASDTWSNTLTECRSTHNKKRQSDA